MESKTPRTDAALFVALGERNYDTKVVTTGGFARQLETELAELRQDVNIKQQIGLSLTEKCDELQKKLAEAREECCRLQGGWLESDKQLKEARTSLETLAFETGQAIMLRSVDFPTENVEPRSHAIWVAMRKTIEERDEARAEVERWKLEADEAADRAVRTCNASSGAIEVLEANIKALQAETKALKKERTIAGIHAHCAMEETDNEFILQQRELAEAPAEVERLNADYAAFSDKSKAVCIDYAGQIERKNALIKQMRVALKGANTHFDRNYWNVKNDADFEDLNKIWLGIEAALSAAKLYAAERGE